MKCIKTEDAVGHVLCHDMTQIIPGVSKGRASARATSSPRRTFRCCFRGVRSSFTSGSCSRVFCTRMTRPERLCALCQNANMRKSETKEGKIELSSDIDGVFLVDTERLNAVNSIDEIMIATRRGNGIVHPGDKLCGTRVIPLVIEEEKLRQAEQAAGRHADSGSPPVYAENSSRCYHRQRGCKGPYSGQLYAVVERKLAALGIRMTEHVLVKDGIENVAAAIEQMKNKPVDMILCTGGMSVDPDDSTPGAIKQSGADIVTYGAPVLPGAMFLLGYYADGRPVMGLPGCVMYAKATIFDLVLPRIAAGVRLTRRDFVALGEGGLCLGCEVCTYPHCGFGGV